jgi:hypothetical protein
MREYQPTKKFFYVGWGGLVAIGQFFVIDWLNRSAFDFGTQQHMLSVYVNTFIASIEYITIMFNL